jgi:hypothetical protein
MPITIDGDGTITGVSVGGLPDGIVDTDMLAADAVTDAKQSLSGAAKAWVNFDGTGTVAIRDSFNVSSITDNGTGLYTLSFTNPMPNANYCWAGSVGRTSASTSTVSTIELPDNEALSTNMTTTSLKIDVVSVNSAENRSNADRQFISVIVFGG